MNDRPVDVPDVPSAVVGWRAWTVRTAGRRPGPRLASPLRGDLWPAQRELVATCASHTGHDAPASGCACGLYAVTDPAGTMGVTPDGVLGCVSLWGTVVEGTQGWRASRGYPLLLVVGPEFDELARVRLAASYHVPVHRSPVGLPELVRWLSLGCRRQADGLRAGTTTWAELEAAVMAERTRAPAGTVDGYQPVPFTEWRYAVGALVLAGALPVLIGGLYGLLLRAAASPWITVPTGLVAGLVVLAAVFFGGLLYEELAPPGGRLLAVVALGPAQPVLATLVVSHGWRPVAWTLVAATALVVILCWTAVLLGLRGPPTGPRAPGLAVVLTVSAVLLAPEVLAGVIEVPGPVPPPLLAPVTAASGPEVLPVSSQSPTGVAFAPDGRSAYVADGSADGALTVVDTTTGRTTAATPLGAPAHGVGVSPDGRRAYVPVTGTDEQPGTTVAVLDTATHGVVASIAVGRGPRDVIVSPDGRRAYVGNAGTAAAVGSTVSVIDTATSRVVDTVPVVTGPGHMAVSPDGSRLYVPGYGFSTSAGSAISIVDAATGATATAVVGDWSPRAVLSGPDGRRVYVVCAGTDRAPGSVRALDTVTGVVTRLGTAPVRDAVGAALTPDGRTLVVLEAGTGAAPGPSVSLIDTATGGRRSVTLDGRPGDVGITPDGREAWVTTADARLWRVPLAPP